MSEQKQEVLSHELLAAIGDYGHAKYRHDNDIITLGAWEDLITAIKVWNRSALAAKDARIAELEEHCKRLGAGDAERYWEGRWRDADAELSRLRDAATHSEDGPEEMQFAYLHPNGERHTVTVSREEVLREMPDFLFEKLCGNFCQC